jgi:hypothetical protein
MNAPLKQQIDETLEHLSETHIAEVLDFVQFLESKERQRPPHPPQQASLDEALAQLRQIVKTPAKGRLGPPYLDTTGFKFDREEANER